MLQTEIFPLDLKVGCNTFGLANGDLTVFMRGGSASKCWIHIAKPVPGLCLLPGRTHTHTHIYILQFPSGPVLEFVQRRERTPAVENRPQELYYSHYRGFCTKIRHMHIRSSSSSH